MTKRLNDVTEESVDTPKPTAPRPNSAKTPPSALAESVRMILVPLGNPETAPDLLRLAVALAEPENGKIIALSVAVGDVERDAETIGKLEETIERFKDDGHEIISESVNAPSISRGILDAVRELGADLVILGIQQPMKGQVVLGAVVENVVDICPCDVALYRRAQKSEFERVVIPIESSFENNIAAEMGIRLSKHYNTRIEAIYAQGSNHTQYEGLAHIEAAIADLDGSEAVKRTVVTAQNPVDAVLARTEPEDMIVVGFSERNDLEKWLFGDVSLVRGLLNRAEGPVVVVSHSTPQQLTTRVGQRILHWLRPALTRMEQDDIVRLARDMAGFNIDYMVLILISATLASLGLLLNSGAVIIGAMLVAPLMSPLIALSTGVTVGRVMMARTAFTTLVTGVLLALVVSIAIGVLLPTTVPTAEMLSRGSPTLIDAAVALASGMVGAYATARRDIPAALAGVAIAAALMPPICTIGLGIAFQDPQLALGATLLFLTNIICIILAGIGVFLWLGMSIHRYPNVSVIAQYMAIGLLVLVALPIGTILVDVTRAAQQEENLRRRLEDALAPAEVTEFEINYDGVTEIIATVRSEGDLTERDVRDVELSLGAETGRTIQLELVVQPVLRLRVEPITEEEAEQAAQELAEETPAAEATAEAE